MSPFNMPYKILIKASKKNQGVISFIIQQVYNFLRTLRIL